MPADFQTTHWSLILAAGPNDSEWAARAWEKLAETYWYPVYGQVRRHGASPDEAQDLVQEFFSLLLGRQALGSLGRERGRFRIFLLTALRNFLIDCAAHTHALKRRGGPPPWRRRTLSAFAMSRRKPANLPISMFFGSSAGERWTPASMSGWPNSWE